MAFDAVDVHVGSRIQLRRTLLGMSQTELGEASGVTFQQIQKYERGANRVSASRLWRLAIALDVPLQYFFDEMPQELVVAGRSNQSEDGNVDGPYSARESLELFRAYYQIKDQHLRDRVRALVQAMARSFSDEAGESHSHEI